MPTCITRIVIYQVSFGFASFRPRQLDAITTCLEGRDRWSFARNFCSSHHHHSLVVMPTGSGKSLCYQFPAVFTSKTAVVVSPLIRYFIHSQESPLCLLQSDGRPSFIYAPRRGLRSCFALGQQQLSVSSRSTFVPRMEFAASFKS